MGLSKHCRATLRSKKNHPEVTTDLKSTCPQLHESSVFHRLSPVRDQHGRLVYFALLGHWKDDLCSWEDLLRVFTYDLHLGASDADNQGRGTVGIADFKDFSIRKMKGLTPSLVKTIAELLQGGFPIKVKAIILINYSWIVNTLLNMVWPFLSAKLRSRVFLLDNYASLHKLIDPACLPSDYEGQLGPITEMGTVEEVVKPATNIFDCLDKCKCM